MMRFYGMTAALALIAAPIAADTARSTASAALFDAAGKPIGTATVRAGRDGLRVRVRITGAPAGERGIHIHAIGKCDPPGFQSAGGHWNPGGRQHGRDNPQGVHQGDLPNIIVKPSGKGSLSFTVPAAALTGEAALLDADGAALVIHEKADDYRTDPTGNSGGRVICGVFR
jgi:Cu-Zn family superoxide dismutase